MSDLLDFSPPGQLANDSLAGAKAYFYDAGTTTPRTVYSDSALSTAHPSPLVADANGLFAQTFVSGSAVKVVVKDSADATLYTLDPCSKIPASGSAASAVSFSPTAGVPESNVQDAIESVAPTSRTAGNVIYTDGADLVGLGIGSAGQVLAVNSGATAPEWKTLLIDEDNMASDDATKAPTQQSVKAYIPVALNANGSAPIYACRAWVRFNGTGTVAIQASGNVSSITDRGTGAYTVNFTTALEDANYGFAASAGSPAANTAAYAHAANGIAPTASALAIDVITDAGTRQDAAYVAVAVFR